MLIYLAKIKTKPMGIEENSMPLTGKSKRQSPQMQI